MIDKASTFGVGTVGATMATASALIGHASTDLGVRITPIAILVWEPAVARRELERAGIAEDVIVRTLAWMATRSDQELVEVVFLAEGSALAARRHADRRN